MLLSFALALHKRLSEKWETRRIGRRVAHHGQGLVEYALILAFIGVVTIGSLAVFQGRISGLFSRVGNSLSGTAAAAPTAVPNACPAGLAQMTGEAFVAAYGHVSGSNRDVGQVEVPPGSNNWFLCVNTTPGAPWVP